jgi:opacity protein-like surface antigen
MAAAAVTIPFLSGTATAQELLPQGLYVGGEIGGVVHQNFTFTDTSPGAANCDLCTSQFPSSLKNGWVAGGKIGYRLTPNFRADFTLDYLSRVSVTGQSTTVPPSTGSANLASLVGLYNVYADLTPIPALGFLQPYLTAGLGFARNSLGVTSGNSVLGPFTISSNSETNFAWDVGLGVSVPLSPGISGDLGYRFMELGEIRTGSIVTIGGQSLQLTASKTGPANVHAVTIGLRYTLW